MYAPVIRLVDLYGEIIEVQVVQVERFIGTVHIGVEVYVADRTSWIVPAGIFINAVHPF